MSLAATAMSRRWSFPIAMIRGTAVRIHFTFLLLLMGFGVAGLLSGGPLVGMNTVLFIILLFLCVVLHEFGHITAASYFGVRTPEIVLLPIGGVARLERIPEEPLAELLIAAAGPAVTLAIAVILLLLLGGLPPPETVLSLDGPQALIAQLVLANVILFVFNLVPAFPMDGGRILRALLSARMGHQRGTRIAAGIGQGFAVLLGVAGVLSPNVLLVLVAVFVYFAAASERSVVEVRGITSGRPAGELMITHFLALAPDDPVSQGASAVIRSEQREFPVLDENGDLRGLLTRDGIVRALVESGPETRVEQVMSTGVRNVSRWTRMDDIVPLLASGAPAVGVIDDHGACIGYITWENLTEELLINRALEQRAKMVAKGSRNGPSRS
ncbi:MAG: site-2 protease family protein [Erythrobacter sp.]